VPLKLTLASCVQRLLQYKIGMSTNLQIAFPVSSFPESANPDKKKKGFQSQCRNVSFEGRQSSLQIFSNVHYSYFLSLNAKHLLSAQPRF